MKKFWLGKLKCNMSPVRSRRIHSESGQVLVYALGVVALLVIAIFVILGVASGISLGARRSTFVWQATYLAEAGIEKALRELAQNPNYTGEIDTPLGAGQVSVTVTGWGTDRTITATGLVGSVKRTIRIQARQSTDNVQFFYGVQVDDGGLTLGNNARVVGNIFSNGNLTGSNGATITGDVIVSGGLGNPNLTIDTANNDQNFGDADGRRDAAQSFTPTATGSLSRLSLYLKKVGSPADLTIKIVSDNANNPSQTVLASATIDKDNVGTTYSWINLNFPAPPTLNAGTRYWVIGDMGKNPTNYYVWGERVSQTTAVSFEDATTDGDLANFPSNNSGSGDPAQSFTTPSSGLEVTAVDLYLKRLEGTSPSDIYLELRQTSPVGAIVARSTSIDADTVPTTGLAWVTFTFPNPVPLAGNTQYYLRLRSQPDSTVPFSGSQPLLHWGYRQTPSSPYLGGDAYRYVGRNNNPADSGQILTQYDFGFRVQANPTTAGGRLSDNWNAARPVWTHSFGDLNYKIWIGGTLRKLEKITVGGEARANTIRDSTITGNAYFQTLINTLVLGSQFPNSPDEPRQDLPLSDGVIADWKADAAAGGTYTGDYILTNGATGSLGPQKITGKLKLDNGAHLTVTGTLWVEGDIELSNNCLVDLDPGYGANSGIILTDGKVKIDNNCAFVGSGNPASYILLLSAKDSIAEEIMDISNNSVGVIYYAGRGRIKFSNNALAKEATAYGITLDNNATITYESGLANVNFTSGPGGGWQIVPNTWQILPPN